MRREFPSWQSRKVCSSHDEASHLTGTIELCLSKIKLVMGFTELSWQQSAYSTHPVIQKTAALEVDRTKSFIWVSSAQLWSIARISRSGFLYFVSNMWTKERKRWIERTQIFIYHLIISTHDAHVLPSLFKKFLWQTSWWVSSSYRMF